ncbi:MAG TPA: LON peptidase substrate-binding domain-containing protein [Acidimicrobiales bacterium]|jgi:Lon protease-like protein|nr:LON peptidase substrate-binding domain-containing protein [Acidimicrobiales bacterium]
MTGLALELPMFPLGSVLLPSTAISLHVFEDRYRALARRCMDGDRRLGVVLIERGSEVGGGDVRFDVATRARIDDAVELDDGRWVMVLVGEDRIRVQRWLPDDPYPRAEVVVCEEPPIGPEAAARRSELEAVLREVRALQVELGDVEARRDAALAADPVVATWQAVALGPLGPLDAQRILATDGPAARLDLVVSLLAEEAAVLAQRLGGG